ncbi:MAG TPA: insulinase family protein [Myxococcales bacterium]|nr:insulinase family protein [Myxococcales bacterium]HIN86943.1 insulinase family protein [Myxococcales bacterium]
MNPIMTPTNILEQVQKACPDAHYEFINAQAFGGNKEIRKFVLHNGLTVLFLRDEAAPLFAYHTWMRVGSRHEKEGRTGIAHLFEHLMFKATKNHGEGEFDRLMERRGAQTNAATWVDWTYYHEVLPASGDNLEFVIQMESERMANLILNSDQLESEREVVKNERLYRVDDDPDGTMFEVLYKLALPDYPYGWPTIGWMKDIEAISLDDCMEFYRRYYSPNNAVVVLVGDVDPVESLSLIARYYGHLEAQDIPVETVPELPRIDDLRRKEMKLAISQERMIMCWIGPGLHDPDLMALDVAMEILFGGDSSRIHRRLVVDTEMASSVGGWATHFEYPGLMEISVSMKPGRAAEEAEEAILEELAAMVDAPPSDAELTKARNQFESSLYHALTTANARAGKLGHYEITVGDYRKFMENALNIRKVTAADVHRVAQRIFKPDGRAVVVARPAGGGE